MFKLKGFAEDKMLGECNTILSAYTLYRHLGWFALTHRKLVGLNDRFIFERREKISGKVENAGYWLLLFPKCFLKPSFPGSLKVRIV